MTKQGIYFRLLVELRHNKAPEAALVRDRLDDVLSSLRNDIARETRQTVEYVQKHMEEAACDYTHDKKMPSNMCTERKHFVVPGFCACVYCGMKIECVYSYATSQAGRCVKCGAYD